VNQDFGLPTPEIIPRFVSTQAFAGREACTRRAGPLPAYPACGRQALAGYGFVFVPEFRSSGLMMAMLRKLEGIAQNGNVGLSRIFQQPGNVRGTVFVRIQRVMIHCTFCAARFFASMSVVDRKEWKGTRLMMTQPRAKQMLASFFATMLALTVLGDHFALRAQGFEASQQAQSADRVSSGPAARGDGKGSELFSKLVERNEERTRRLRQYNGIRQYELRNDQGKLAARTVVRMEYRAPDIKIFNTVSEEGSRWIRTFVFNRLMKNEAEAAAGREKRDSSITPHNYAFRFAGEEDAEGYPCYRVEAIPKRKDKYLFEGNVWIDSRDFAVVKIVAHPARNPSFWIKRVDWVRRYGKVGDFWLPVKDETVTDIRIFGVKHLSIDYRDYIVNPQPSATRMSELGAARSARSGATTNGSKPHSPGIE